MLLPFNARNIILSAGQPDRHFLALAEGHVVHAAGHLPLTPLGYGAMRASGRPGQMPSASWPARSPIASRRAGSATSRPGRPCPYCVTPPRVDTDPPDGVSLTMWSNTYAERFVLTARTEVTDRMLIFGQRHLRTILAHYNGRRPHRSRQLRPPRPDHPVADLSQERIKRRPILGGLINGYERAA